uniref:Uncharacterized protein n=1 Tax=Triticum urartu TaxID=4572 RepID=A0A8R7TXR5_TRIUA
MEEGSLDGASRAGNSRASCTTRSRSSVDHSSRIKELLVVLATRRMIKKDWGTPAKKVLGKTGGTKAWSSLFGANVRLVLIAGWPTAVCYWR